MSPPPDNKSLFIHLGLPKTASTFLQEKVFPELDGLVYMPKHYYSLSAAGQAGTGRILLTCEKDFELNGELDRVHQLLPEARIILVFREPYSWLVSKYKYSIRKHGRMSFAEYLEHLAADQGIGPGFYSGVIRRLETLFPGQFLVLDYAELGSNARSFVSRIEGFTGSLFPENLSSRIVKPAFSERKLVRLRRFNRKYPYRESSAYDRMFRFLHYKYREFLLHIVAFFSGLLPADTEAFTAEIEAQRHSIESAWAEDWNAVQQAVSAKTP